MKTARQVLVVWLGFSVVAHCQGNNFDKIRYQGGTIQTKVSPKDWDNRLTVTSEEIRLDLEDGQTVRIDPKRVEGLSYGQEAHRRVGTMIALGVLLAPVALLGLFHKTRLHYIGIEFTTTDGKKSGLLIQGHKDNYRAVLMALRGATGAPVSASEDDRKYVPAGVEVISAESSGEGATKEDKSEPAPSAAETAKTSTSDAETDLSTLAGLILKSTPAGAEITVDGKYMGNTPSTLRLEAGDHTIKLAKSGFIPWSRTITLNPGSDITIGATLKDQSLPLRLDEINDLLAGGVANTRLVQLVQERGVAFRLDGPTEQQLRHSGAQDELINAIRNSSLSSRVPL